LHRSAPLITAIAAAVALSACASGRLSARTGVPAAAPSAPFLDGSQAAREEGQDGDSGRPRDAGPVVIDQAFLVIREANDRYILGEEAYRSGDLDLARRHFDAALLTFMTCGLDVQNDPRLKDAYDRMAQDIQSLEAEALASSEGENRVDPDDTPVEELKDIKEFLTPEELALEMKKVRPMAAADNFSLPVVLNEQVLTLMEAWQTHFGKAFAGGYQRMGRYETMIRQVLREEGLPEDLVYLAFTESTFKTSAYSRARAKGMWQFMASTGKRYGLARTSWVDERSDPEKSTRAAAAYLKELYGMFNDWYLVLAAYNAGEGLVQKAIDRTGKRDFWELTKTRYFRAETKNFVPSILALSLMSRDPSGYGFADLQKDPPLNSDQVTVDGPADLSLVAKLAGTTVDEIKSLNPELTRGVTPPGVKSYRLRVPAGKGDSFQAAYASLPASQKIANVRSIPSGRGRGRSMDDVYLGDDGRYVVQRGDTLSGIARQFGTSVRAITSANGITEKSLLHIGQSIRVPIAGARPTSAAPAKSASSAFSQAPARTSAQKVAYRVRRGDNLYRIARKYGTTVESLRSWNGLQSSSAIYPGDVLTIYAR